MKRHLAAIGTLCFALSAMAAPLPIFDSHLHYSADAWEQLPPTSFVASHSIFYIAFGHADPSAECPAP